MWMQGDMLGSKKEPNKRLCVFACLVVTCVMWGGGCWPQLKKKK